MVDAKAGCLFPTPSLTRLLPVFLVIAMLLSVNALPAGASDARTGTPSGTLQVAFHRAAHEFGVPESVLLAVSYNVSLWDDHRGMPSTSGGYGVMHLTHVDLSTESNLKGDGVARAVQPNPSLHTLDTAAGLLHLPVRILERDPTENIRGGAVLLARYARETVGRLPKDPRIWYGAVARFSGSSHARTAIRFADAVFASIRHGERRITANGQLMHLAARPIVADRHSAQSLHLLQQGGIPVQCPQELDCRFVPAAYQVNDPRNPEDYGNYDVANRQKDGMAIRYIVIHDTESTYSSAVDTFQNPTRYASSNYVIRSSDGQITQMVHDRNIAWHAGNYYVNMHAIGIEHEGVAIEGATWYNEQLYRSSATLVQYLAQKYHIPLDRAHIIGHDEVPGPTPVTQGSQHWDPGPFWNWSHYMELINGPLSNDSGAGGAIVTINPDFATNQPPVTYCRTVADCRTLSPQPSNFVYLYTAPSLDAPLLSDPALHPNGEPGTTRANDWGDKAVSGQQFYRVDQVDNWDAIDYGGQKAWFYNPGHTSVTVPSSGQLVTPRAGLTSIPVYGRAYPKRSAYPSWIKKPEKLVPLQYRIPAGQAYVALDPVSADFYWSPTQTKHRLVQSSIQYRQIFFNHRFAFVRAGDVDLLP